MKRRDHATPEAARRELVEHGYMPAHVPPSEPRELWIPKHGKGPALAIYREDRPRSQVWHLMENLPTPPPGAQLALLEGASA